MEKLTEESLRQFTGTDGWYRHAINKSILYTDGAKYVAEVGGAYWLLDAIAIANKFDKRVNAEQFQAWILKKNKTGNGAKLICHDGNYNRVYKQQIPFTDFPLDRIELWCEGGTIMLPSER